MTDKYKPLIVDLIFRFPKASDRVINPICLRGTLNDVLQTVIQRRFPLFEVEIGKIYRGEEEDPTLGEKIYLLEEDIKDEV